MYQRRDKTTLSNGDHSHPTYQHWGLESHALPTELTGQTTCIQCIDHYLSIDIGSSDQVTQGIWHAVPHVDPPVVNAQCSAPQFCRVKVSQHGGHKRGTSCLSEMKLNGKLPVKRCVCETSYTWQIIQSHRVKVKRCSVLIPSESAKHTKYKNCISTVKNVWARLRHAREPDRQMDKPSDYLTRGKNIISYLNNPYKLLTIQNHLLFYITVMNTVLNY